MDGGGGGGTNASALDETLLVDYAHNQLHQHQELAADQATPTKLLASLILFAITLLCGYVPVRMILNQNYIQHAMFAGGGVLMATAFCHLIPEAHDNYRQLASPAASHMHAHSHSHSHTHLHQEEPPAALGPAAPRTTTADDQLQQQQSLRVPYLEVTLCCGFFFMYLVEQLMVRFINNHSHEHPCDATSARDPSGQLTHYADVEEHQCESGSGGGGGGASSSAGSTSVGNLSSAAIIVASTQTGASSMISANSYEPNANTPAATKRATEFYKFIRGLLIVSAFGAHSIFDGVAIGSQESSEKVWTILFAISCHKLIIAAVVGLELFAATLESHLWTLVHLLLFSLMSPLGIILVVIAQSSLKIDSNDPAMILLQSFATGTLLYIIFVEILQPKGDQVYEKQRFSKSFSLLAGFGLMLLVLTLLDH